MDKPYVHPCDSCGEGFMCYLAGRKYCCDTCETKGAVKARDKFMEEVNV